MASLHFLCVSRGQVWSGSYPSVAMLLYTFTYVCFSTLKLRVPLGTREEVIGGMCVQSFTYS